MARILVVDDDDLLRSLLVEVLEMNGHVCTGASSVLEAKRALGKGVFDLVLSDFDMPGENGLSLLRHVTRKYRSMGFILMTASADGRTRDRAYALGAHAYLSKPFNMKVLLRVVEQVAAGPRRPFFRIENKSFLRNCMGGLHPTGFERFTGNGLSSRRDLCV